METKNIFLFTGEEKYLLDQELNRRKDGFISKFGADSLFTYNSQTFSSDQAIQALYTSGLFVSKKMLIIKGLPIDTNDTNKISAETAESFILHFQKNGSQIPDDTILIFISYKPDGRSAFLKSLKSTISKSNIKTFPKLKSFGLKDFIRQQLSDFQIHELDVEYFLIKIGEDLYRIVYECQKLIIRCQLKNIKTIDHSIIDEVCFGMVQSNAFQLFDNLLGNPAKTISLIDKIREDGTHRIQFAGAVYRGLKSFLFTLDLYQQGIKDSKQIFDITKIHPFAISKNLKKIVELQKNQLKIKNFYTKLVELDADIKTGKFPDTYFRLGIKKIILSQDFNTN